MLIVGLEHRVNPDGVEELLTIFSGIFFSNRELRRKEDLATLPGQKQIGTCVLLDNYCMDDIHFFLHYIGISRPMVELGSPHYVYVQVNLLFPDLCLCVCVYAYVCYPNVCTTLTDSYASLALRVLPWDQVIKARSFFGYESLPAASSTTLHHEQQKHWFQLQLFNSSSKVIHM